LQDARFILCRSARNIQCQIAAAPQRKAGPGAGGVTGRGRSRQWHPCPLWQGRGARPVPQPGRARFRPGVLWHRQGPARKGWPAQPQPACQKKGAKAG